MSPSAPIETAPNPLREAALARLQETVSGLNPTELVDDPELILQTAVNYSHWVHTTWRDISRYPLDQASASLYVGFTRIAASPEVNKHGVARARANEYLLTPAFRHMAHTIIERIPDDPETRSLIFFRHGILAAVKLKRERAQAN